jgi:hypothetical protein
MSFALMGAEFYDENKNIIPMNPDCVRSLTSWTARQSFTYATDWVSLFISSFDFL